MNHEVKHNKRSSLRAMILLVLMLACIFSNSFYALARANACQNCSNGSYRCTKTEYVWKETGETKTCDDCGSIRRKLQKYAVKTYKCNNCSSHYTTSTKLSNTMWACEC